MPAARQPRLEPKNPENRPALSIGTGAFGTGAPLRPAKDWARIRAMTTNENGYELLDSGGGRKLERFGRVVLARPCAQAVWRPALPEADRRAIEAVDSHIRAHLAEGLANDELASVACMRLTKFKQAFRQVYAMTPQSYVTALRIERASKLLRETDLPVASIAREVGYGKPGAFALAFRRRTGTTPTEFRGWG